MPHRNRLITYILLNILISALTTLLVLWIWDRPHRLNDQSTLVASAKATVSAMAQPTFPVVVEDEKTTPVEINILIENIFGAGNLNSEVVVIKNKSSGSLSLKDWRLENGRGSSFTFPNLALNPEGTVQLHSSAGIDTVNDLFWKQDTAVWQVQDQATLIDDQGTVRATYEIR